jgi:hypothetical protein
MRSRRVSLRVPWPLADEMEKICREEEFESTHACWIGAGIIFVQNHRRRSYVRVIANAKPKTQDYLLTHLFSFPADLKGMLETLARLDKK